jgi:hypothetical protein
MKNWGNFRKLVNNLISADAKYDNELNAFWICL